MPKKAAARICRPASLAEGSTPRRRSRVEARCDHVAVGTYARVLAVDLAYRVGGCGLLCGATLGQIPTSLLVLLPPPPVFIVGVLLVVLVQTQVGSWWCRLGQVKLLGCRPPPGSEPEKQLRGGQTNVRVVGGAHRPILANLRSNLHNIGGLSQKIQQRGGPWP
jgi:hypothetical protein